MEYAYYPGCSLEDSGRPYDISIRGVFEALGLGLRELEDWNCCGATMYMSSHKLVGYALSARNLAMAKDLELDVCAPCSSCYTILRKTNRHLTEHPQGKARINEALAAAGLSYEEPVAVRHPLDILVNDLGLDAIREATKRPLGGLKVAPYYGCQIVRPHGAFDDVDRPVSLDQVMAAMGAEVVEYPSKVRCCGGMLMMTSEEVALDLNRHLLKCAEANEAEVIVTACPLCQLNLEAYQGTINKRHGDSLRVPVVYFSQLMGLALGLPDAKTGLDKMMIPLPEVATS